VVEVLNLLSQTNIHSIGQTAIPLVLLYYIGNFIKATLFQRRRFKHSMIS
jgi:hypothetical protein